VGPELERVPNVASARVAGGKVRQILVHFDRQRLRAFNLSPDAVIQAVQQANLTQQDRFARRILDYFGAGAARTTLALWGLAFKARTDDVRESPALYCAEKFLAAGMKIRAYDPEAMPAARVALDNRIETVKDSYDALDGADALVICADWQEFRTPDFDRIAQKLHRPVIFDGRNLYDPAYVKKQGLEYHSIGRP